MRRTPALILAATTAVLLAACTGDTDGTATPAPDDATTAPAPEDAEPLAPATAGCLLGTWRLDLAAMQDDLRRSGAEYGLDVEVAGTSTYEFAEDGRFSAEVDSSSTLTMASEESELVSRTSSTGSLTATWALEGDQLTIADIDTTDLDVSTSATLDDEDLDVPPASAQDGIETLPPTSSTAFCGDARATLVMPLLQDEDSDPVTLTYTLRR